MRWKQQGDRAVRAAARLRQELGYGPADAACPIDICIHLNLDVWFQAHPSVEGLYAPGSPPRVIISSLRPAGRRRYTAGHELGHHVHGHGASLDAQLNDENKLNEFIANRFSRALLMPKLAVANAYSRRGWAPRKTTAAQAFTVSQDLGVGFKTLLDHMSRTLRLLDTDSAEALGRKHLPKLRAELAGTAVPHDLFPVDAEWGSRPLDIEVGDVIVASGAQFLGDCVVADGGALRATRAGTGELAVPGRAEAICVRVSRREFSGRARYRHLEDDDAA